MDKTMRRGKGNRISAFIGSVKRFFKPSHLAPYPESGSGIKLGDRKKQNPKETQEKGRFGSRRRSHDHAIKCRYGAIANRTSLRYFKRRMARYLDEKRTMHRISGKARIYSRPLNRDPFATKRAAKRRQYANG